MKTFLEYMAEKQYEIILSALALGGLAGLITGDASNILPSSIMGYSAYNLCEMLELGLDCYLQED